MANTHEGGPGRNISRRQFLVAGGLGLAGIALLGGDAAAAPAHATPAAKPAEAAKLAVPLATPAQGLVAELRVGPTVFRNIHAEGTAPVDPRGPIAGIAHADGFLRVGGRHWPTVDEGNRVIVTDFSKPVDLEANIGKVHVIGKPGSGRFEVDVRLKVFADSYVYVNGGFLLKDRIEDCEPPEIEMNRDEDEAGGKDSVEFKRFARASFPHTRTISGGANGYFKVQAWRKADIDPAGKMSFGTEKSQLPGFVEKAKGRKRLDIEFADFDTREVLVLVANPDNGQIDFKFTNAPKA